jgi:hypothetical protein
MQIVLLTLFLAASGTHGSFLHRNGSSQAANALVPQPMTGESQKLVANGTSHDAKTVAFSNADSKYFPRNDTYQYQYRFVPYPTPDPKMKDQHHHSIEKHQYQMGYPRDTIADASDEAAERVGWEPHPYSDVEASYWSRVFWQLVFAIGYWFLVVKNYPVLPREFKPSNPEATALQSKNEVMATIETSPANCIMSLCCTGPRAAHTFHATGVMHYWLGCCLMSCCPMCTLWYANSMTDLNERLGGTKRDLVMGFLCACLCSCCVVAQDAESLDIVTGMETHCCTASRKF